jgi:hypothetical protein
VGQESNLRGKGVEAAWIMSHIRDEVLFSRDRRKAYALSSSIWQRPRRGFSLQFFSNR